MNTAAARHTLSIIKAAVPLDDEFMFPDYHDHAVLCADMERSLSAWEDAAFVADVIICFRSRNAEGCRRGMRLAQERVHFHLPLECGWSYMGD